METYLNGNRTAAVLYGREDLKIERVPIPNLAPDEEEAFFKERLGMDPKDKGRPGLDPRDPELAQSIFDQPK